MSVLKLGIIGLDIEVLSDSVIINDKVRIKKPKGCSVSDWEKVWNRMDKDYGFVENIEKDGHIVIDLDED